MHNSNQEKMQRLLQDFYNLTNIKTCLYDSTENELCFYPQKLSDFCALLRQDKAMDERCKACDKHAFAECRKSYKQYFYTCHAGLQECVSPILFDKEIIGFIVLGQIKSNENADFSCLETSLPPKRKAALKAAFDRLPTIPPDKLSSAIAILDACTGYEYLKTLMKNNERKIDVKIGKYVHENLAEMLSVPILCSKFRMSHSELYSVFKEYYHSTPAEYIKKCRLEYACKLLKETALPVGVIAKRCGIPDYNYFSKIFKKTYGVCPRTYKKGELPR